MPKFQTLSKFTISCYLIAVVLIGLILANDYWSWLELPAKIRVGVLVVAVIIGVSGSLYSILKQLKVMLSKKSWAANRINAASLSANGWKTTLKRHYYKYH